MLTELEIEAIEEDLARGVEGPRMSAWVRMLLQDRDERIRNEREVAVHLLATAPSHATHPHPADPPPEHPEPPHRPKPHTPARVHP